MKKAEKSKTVKVLGVLRIVLSVLGCLLALWIIVSRGEGLPPFLFNVLSAILIIVLVLARLEAYLEKGINKTMDSADDSDDCSDSNSD